MANEAPTLLEVLESATSADLEAVEQQIHDLDRRAASLKAVQKLLRIKLHGEPEKKKRQPRAERNGEAQPRGIATEGQREKAGEYLLKVGIANPMQIADNCAIPRGSITGVLNHFYFEKTPQGIQLSKSGKQTFG